MNYVSIWYHCYWLHDYQSRIALSAYLYWFGSLIVGSLFVFIFLQYLQNIITTFAGTGTDGVSGDGGPATSAQLGNPSGIATDISGNLYIADNTYYSIRKVNKAGIITTFAGRGSVWGDGVQATSALLSYPMAVTSDISGNVYICDQLDAVIRMVASTGIITTIAGSGTMGTSGDGGPATSADLYFPQGVAVDTSGNVYICDFYNSKTRLVTSSGIIANFAGGGSVLGDGGPATSASLSSPWGIAVDIFSNNVYICDSGNNRIRMVNSTGIITTIAGVGTSGGSGDGGAATAAQLNSPRGVAIDIHGNVYIADSGNQKIRFVSSTGIITTIAGTGVPGSSGDGGPASSAKLYQPQGVALDAHGHLYITESVDRKVRSVLLSASPTVSPTQPPTGPTSQPSAQPSKQPSQQPTSRPSRPSGQPSRQPSGMAVVDIGLNPSILSSNHAPVSTLTVILTLLI